MQKWLPDELNGEKAGFPAAQPQWESLPAVAGASVEDAARAQLFQKESRFADPNSLLNNLTQEERAMLFDLVEQDVRRQYQEREAKLVAEQEAALTAARADYDQRLEAWAREFGEGILRRWEATLEETSKAAANLAVQLAGKIVRETVPLDSEVLVRAIRTTLFKVPGSQKMRISLNPVDAKWLQARPELVEELNLGEVEIDRRIERGGCVLRSGVREWDATIAGQLEALGEVVSEAIATADAAKATVTPANPETPETPETPIAPAPEDTDDPGLE